MTTGRFAVPRRCVGIVAFAVCLGSFWLGLSVARADDIACKKPEETPAPELCFVEYAPSGTRAVDPRLTDAFPPPPQGAKEIRSFAVVVSISEYPNFTLPDGQHLNSVKRDLPDIIAFLKDQKFDEIILLKDEKADWDSIDHVLRDYILNRVKEYKKRSRFLFVYDGHGSKPLAVTPGGPIGSAMALSSVNGDPDPDSKHTFALEDLQTRLDWIATFAYQSLALLGSCYSGGVFHQTDPSGQTYDSTKPGAHAVTAAKPDELAWEHNPGGGTVFFDYFLYTARHEAGPKFNYSAVWLNDEAGQPLKTGVSIARLMAIVQDINGYFEHSKNPKTGQPYPLLSIGSLAPMSKYEGAFFFLGAQAPETVTVSLNTNLASPAKTQTISLPQNAPTNSAFSTEMISVQQNTGSAIIKHPELKVFNIPEAYKIRGIDISHYSDISSSQGDTEFKKLRDADVHFVYMKASEGATFIDPKFVGNLTRAVNNQFDVGIYHVFSPCSQPAGQLQNIQKQIAAAQNGVGAFKMLPIAIDVELAFQPRFVPCVASDFKIRLHEMLRMVEEAFGKKPMIYVPAFATSQLLDSSFDAYPLWFAQYSRSTPAQASQPPRLSGTNPWTLWQFTNEATFEGLTGRYDLNAFFGSQEQYNKFASEGENVALQAAVGEDSALPNAR